MLVDLSDLVGALAGGPDKKRPFDGRLDIDKLANTNNISSGGIDNPCETRL